MAKTPDALSLFRLDKKVALITGGYGHLGVGMTQSLAEAGAIAVVCGRSEAKFKKVFGAKTKPPVYFQEMDVSSTQSVQSGLAAIHKTWRRIDILINNAFYAASNAPEKMTDAEWRLGVEGTLDSVFRCIREAIAFMKPPRGRGGSIINVSSMYGMVSPNFEVYRDNPDYVNPPNYGAAKAGVIQLTRYFAIYLAKKGIRVNCISPGAFPSSDVQKQTGFIRNLEEKIPLGRIGRRDELKGAALFLASEASSYMTGQNIVVDGGWTAW
ncbi:MAG: SDR family oxidoreductase [Candidatus Sumerlaeota bacterium]|nr:SDR family oxidoreductase [Candidatus Sumerlaeota bacterium]